MKDRTEAEIERECVEWVFGLTGGELNDKPWVVFEDPELTDEVSYVYSFDGAPDWSDEAGDHGNTYVTVVSECLTGNEPRRLYMKGSRYERVASWTSSGECACPLEDYEADEPVAQERPCPYCEAQEGEEHGYIYLGDGWSETIYREIKTCTTCRTDLTSHENYGDDRCLRCHPYAFTVEVEEAFAYGDSIVYAGSSPEEAEAAFAMWRERCDVVLSLDDETLTSSTSYDRNEEIKRYGKDLLSRAESYGGSFDWQRFHSFVQATRKPWNDPAEAVGYVRGMLDEALWSAHARVETREYVDGKQVERKGFPRRTISGEILPVDACKRMLHVRVWKRTGTIESWFGEPGTYTLPDGRVVTIEPPAAIEVPSSCSFPS